jgi:hypothetical protein
MDNLMSIRILFILFALSIIVASCSDNSVNSDNEKILGLFIVDSFYTKIDIQQLTENDSLIFLFSYNLNYHFENQPGTIESIFIIIQDSIGRGGYFYNLIPIPVNEPGHFGESFELSGFNLGNIDSIKYDISVSGVFWDYNFKTSKFKGFLDEFNWSESKWILLPK